MSQRIERRIMRLNDQLRALDAEEHLVREELSYHRHINDDAQRDAAIGDADDRAFALQSGRDVERFEKALRGIADRRAKIDSKRQTLLAKLSTG